MNRRAFTRAACLAAACVINGASSMAQSSPPNPGARWTDDELRRAAGTARVGRKLTPTAWPNGARVAVCLSFDVDNESYLLARG